VRKVYEDSRQSAISKLSSKQQLQGMRNVATCLFRALHDYRIELSTYVRNFPFVLPLTSSSRVPGEHRKAAGSLDGDVENTSEGRVT
jgi:hypothetical protein